MFLFKTSGNTINNVIKFQKHAFYNMPQNWFPGELVLVSKNKKDCSLQEKQIQYYMEIVKIREITYTESEKYWPGNKGRWKYIVDCRNCKKIHEPFDLEDIIGFENEKYKPIMTFRKIEDSHEKKILKYLKR